MTDVQSSDAMKDLVLFMTCLAIAGAVVACAYYFAVDLPLQQAALHPPSNHPGLFINSF